MARRTKATQLGAQLDREIAQYFEPDPKPATDDLFRSAGGGWEMRHAQWTPRPIHADIGCLAELLRLQLAVRWAIEWHPVGVRVRLERDGRVRLGHSVFVESDALTLATAVRAAIRARETLDGD